MVSRFTFKQLFGLALGMFCFSTNGFSQTNFSLQANGVFGLTRSKSLNSMIELYNETNVNYIDRTLKKPSFTYGYDIQLDARLLDHLFTAVGFTQANSQTSSKFPNDSKRFLHVKTNYINCFIGYAFGETNEIAIYTGIDGQFSRVSSHVKYANGDRDYLTGQLGGTYSSVGFGVPLGIQYSIPIKDKLQLSFKGQLYLLNATKFTYVNNLRITGSNNSSLIYQGYEVLHDTKRFLISVGLRYKL